MFTGEFRSYKTGVIKLPILGDQTMQIYSNLEGFPLIVHCLGWFHIMTPVKRLKIDHMQSFGLLVFQHLWP